MKSEDADLNAYALIVYAIYTAYAELCLDSSEFDRDFVTLETNYASDPWLLIKDLAECDGILLTSFRESRLPEKRSRLTKRKSNKDRRPRFLHLLWSRIFTADGLLHDTSPELICSIRYLRQIFCLMKKLTKEFSDDQLSESCQNFIDTDRKIDNRRFEAHFLFRNGDLPSLSSGLMAKLFEVSPPESLTSSYDIVAVLRDFYLCAGMVVTSFGSIDPFELKPRHGPGVVSDQKRGSYKYEFPHWSPRLQELFPADWFTSHNFTIKSEFVDVPSKLIAVPKDIKGPRLIAAEPVCLMFMQQALRDWLETSMTKSKYTSTCINLRDQTVSKDLARIGSLDQSLATIDLSEASDRISRQLVYNMFQSNPLLVECLRATRSEYIDLSSIASKATKLDREYTLTPMELEKFSTMGSALTFPVQTLLFSIIAAVAVLHTTNGVGAHIRSKDLKWAMKRVRVYGDDIIVPNDAAEYTMVLLSIFGLKVNTAKSFYTGKFRESCGGDYFDGADITPTKIKSLPSESNPESIIGWVESHNNVLSKGYIALAHTMVAMLPPRYKKNIREKDLLSDCFGIATLSIPKSLPTRVGSTQVREILSYVPLQREKRIYTESDAPCFQYFLEEPDARFNWASGPRSKPKICLSLRWGPYAG